MLGSRFAVKWSGVEWSGVEWSGVEWSGVEWLYRPNIGQTITPNIDPNSHYNHPNTELKSLQK